jgi:predicted O-methyltransferase YrrM
MVNYPLSHLVQPPQQDVWGPIQDDEALFLFAMIRTMCMKRILEIGGLQGYSATNFLVAAGEGARVYTVDLNPVRTVGPGHVTIQKNAALITPEDVESKPLDLVFFDCHVLSVQMTAFRTLRSAGLITDDTVLAWHDTNLHPQRYASHHHEHVPGGWAHQPSERQMVNEIRRLGYDVISLDTKAHMHGKHLPFRHGIAIARMFKPLVT